MNKTIIKIIAVIALISFVSIVVFYDNFIYMMSMIYASMQTNTIVIPILIIVGIGLLVSFPLVKWLYASGELKFASKFIGKGEEKIYNIRECIDACLEHLIEFGFEKKGAALKVYAQLPNNKSSDTPCVMFLASTYKVSQDKKNRIEEIPEHERHFVIVDRKSLECTYNPSISSWNDAIDLMMKKKDMDIPLEKKKTMEQSLLENIKAGMGQSLGQTAVSSDVKPESKETPEVKE